MAGPVVLAIPTLDEAGPIGDFVVGSRGSGTRESGGMAWHQFAAGYLVGHAIRGLYRTRRTDMCERPAPALEASS